MLPLFCFFHLVNIPSTENDWLVLTYYYTEILKNFILMQNELNSCYQEL